MDQTSKAERISAVVLDSLDQGAGTERLARLAHQSRAQFYRLFQALLEESPAAMRRRLLLERAAWQLARTRVSVTEIAFGANYGSLEAFSRAFSKAFRISPGLYRRMGATHFHLPAPNGFHYCAPASRSKGAFNDMDLFDIFAGSDSWHTRRLLEHARDLSDEQLDRPLNSPIKVFPWDKPDQTLREILNRLVYTKEVWTAALTGGEMPPDCDSEGNGSVAVMLARFEKADTEFNSILSDIRKRGAWEDTFVDALCEPPETFTFGGMFAHVITFNTFRRLTALGTLRAWGVPIEGFGCPSEYEASVAARAPVSK